MIGGSKLKKLKSEILSIRKLTICKPSICKLIKPNLTKTIPQGICDLPNPAVGLDGLYIVAFCTRLIICLLTEVTVYEFTVYELTQCP